MAFEIGFACILIPFPLLRCNMRSLVVLVTLSRCITFLCIRMKNVRRLSLWAGGESGPRLPGRPALLGLSAVHSDRSTISWVEITINDNDHRKGSDRLTVGHSECRGSRDADWPQ